LSIISKKESPVEMIHFNGAFIYGGEGEIPLLLDKLLKSLD
jgi:hypothetical protein